MPIAPEGTPVVVDCSAGNTTENITVPAGAEIALVQMSYWDAGASAGPVSACSIGGQGAATPLNINATAAGLSGLFVGVIVLSGSGTQEFALDWTSDEAISEGGYPYISFWSGASDTLRETPQSDRALGGTTVTATLTTETGDVCVTHCEAFQTSTIEMILDTITGQGTSLFDSSDPGGDQVVDVDYFARTQASHVITLSNYAYSSIIGVTLQEGTPSGGGGGSSALPLLNAYYHG